MLFFFALLILLLKANLLFLLFALELILLSVNLNFIFASLFLDDFLGETVALLLFSLAALDTSFGLVVLFNYYNLRFVNLTNFNIKS